MTRVRVTGVDDPDLVWPDPAVGRYLQALKALGPDGVLINARVDLAALQLPGCVFPVVVPDGRQSCWLTSPSVTYGRALRDEVGRHLRGIAAPAARAACRLAEAALNACEADRVVYANHLLFSTSLYGGWDGRGLDQGLAAMRAAWPDRAILWRSLNVADHADLLAAMRARGARLLPSRIVWRLPDPARQWAPRTDVRADLKLATAGGYRLEVAAAPTDDEIARAITLYESVYLAKYSSTNPAYRPAAFRAAVDSGALRLVWVRDRNGRIAAFSADHVAGTEASAPLLGHDQTRPRSEGLYRIAMATSVQRALAEGLAVNYSAGAETFKRHRGATPALEYLAVFDDHLRARRRAGYAMLGRALETVSPMLERITR